MQHILAVISDWDVANTVVGRAESFAGEFGAKVTVYRPVHDQIEELNRYIGFDNYEQMRDEIMVEEKRQLGELLAGKHLHSEIEWRSMPHRGIVELARRSGADLIVMAVSHHSPLTDLLLKPSDWHLLREAPCAVLILTRTEHATGSVTAAIDCLDDSEENLALVGRILEQANSMAKVLSVPIGVVSVIPDPALISADMNNVPIMVDFREEAEKMAEARLQELLEKFNVPVAEKKVDFGRLEYILQHAAESGQLLVIGNMGNKGLRGFFVGNTAERLLHHLKGDMLVVN